MRLTLAILLISASCYGQTFSKSVAFIAASQPVVVSGGGANAQPYGYQTNIPGFPALAWWTVRDLVTNGSSLQIPDATGNGWTLTNSAAAGTWPLLSATGVNGHPMLSFDGVDDYLKQMGIASAQPFEVVVVLAWTNTGNKRLWCASSNNSPPNLYFGIDPDLNVPGSDVETVTLAPSNKWFVVDGVANVSNSKIYTNWVQGASGTLISSSIGGFGITHRTYAGDLFMNCAIAEVIFYGSANGSVPVPGTNTLARSNLWNCLSNYYNISQ